jgi:DNA-binding FrmR family transcriptional regulator
MAHLEENRDKLLNRVRRIRGQLNAVEKALTDEVDCAAVLHPLVACRGALNGLMTEVLEGHIRHHIVDPDRRPTSEQAKATQELLDVLKTYLR